MGALEAASPTENSVYQNRFRQARFRRFFELVDQVLRARETCRIIDVGGRLAYWQAMEPIWGKRALHITLVNLEAMEQINDARFTNLTADACDLSQFADNSFDIAHSNSVIEHVGGWRNQRKMAQEIRRVAPRYFVQTPNFWFPFEPHFRTPFIHWVPEPWQAALVMRRACGFYPRAKSYDEARAILDDARLIDARAMAELFPDGAIERERFAGLTKSLMAIR